MSGWKRERERERDGVDGYELYCMMDGCVTKVHAVENGWIHDYFSCFLLFTIPVVLEP
jgi:hypothetical protein